MDKVMEQIAFGPVPSRRLGLSLGVNNIPPKICSYSCIYCQLGRTRAMSVQRQAFYQPELIFQAVQEKVRKVQEAGETIDYITFVADGEPTLELYLGREIELITSLGIKVAVISNASLICNEGVREALAMADWVSLKVDATQEDTWRSIDRPHGDLCLDAIHRGMLMFARDFKGILATETMLVAGVNDSKSSLESTAEMVGRLEPSVAYLAIPTRPPAETWVSSPQEQILHEAFQIFEGRVPRVEYLIGFEGSAFASTGDVEADLLSITAVHPMRQDSVSQMLETTKTDWSVVYKMMARGLLASVSYNGRTFYMRKFNHYRWEGRKQDA